MLRRLRTFLLPPVVLSLALAACAPVATVIPASATPAPTATAGPITLTDGLGREVTLAALPVKIVSLAPSNTEILFALDAGDLLIGRDDFSDYPPAALAIPSVGSLYPSVNTEAIVALDPDLVLAAGVTSPEDVQKLADLGLTVFTTRIAATINDIYADIRDVGELTGHGGDAAALVAKMQSRVEAVGDKTSEVSDKPLVYYEIDATEPDKPWTAGPGTFHDQLISLAGGENIGNIGTDQYFQISLEQLVAEDPAIIVLGSATFGGQTPETVAARPGWADIAAVKNNTVYTFDDNLLSRPGPRIVDGLEELAKLIHPELFQ